LVQWQPLSEGGAGTNFKNVFNKHTSDRLDSVLHNWDVMFVYCHLCDISFDIGCDVLWKTRQQRVRSSWNVLSNRSCLWLYLWLWYSEVRVSKCCSLEATGLELTALANGYKAWWEHDVYLCVITVVASAGTVLHTVECQCVNPVIFKWSLNFEGRM